MDIKLVTQHIKSSEKCVLVSQSEEATAIQLEVSLQPHESPPGGH